MAYAPVQSTTNGIGSGGSTSINVATTSNVTKNNLLLVYTSYDHLSTPIGVTWSNTLTSDGFTRIGSTYSGGLSVGAEWGVYKNTSGGACTITATYSSIVTFQNILVAEYSGFDTTAPFTAGETASSTYASVAGANSTQSGSTATLSAQPAGVVSVVYDDTNPNSTRAGTGFTKRLDIVTVGGDSLAMEDMRVTSLNAVAGTWNVTTAGDNQITMVAVFREPPAAATFVPYYSIYPQLLAQ